VKLVVAVVFGCVCAVVGAVLATMKILIDAEREQDIEQLEVD
jgi:uncharacterized OsmC-like protein